MLKTYLLKYNSQIGVQSSAVEQIISTANSNPNDMAYFCGLVIALLIQFLVVFDYVSSYAVSSPYFIHSPIPEIRYLVKKFNLKSINDPIVLNKEYWFIAITLFLIELLYSLIQFYYYEKTLLYISVIIWSFTLIQSLISITLFNKYIRNTEDLKIALRVRDKKIFQMQKEIIEITPLWRAEEMQKHGDNYDERFLHDRIQEYQNNKMRAINEIINMKDNYLIEILENLEVEFDGNFREWIQTSTQQNIFNIILYIQYLIICSKDSPYIFDFFCLIGWFNPPMNHVEIFTVYYDFKNLYTAPNNIYNHLFLAGWEILNLALI